MKEKLQRRSPLSIVVLALLAEAPMHAYQMQVLIKERGQDTLVNVAQRNSVYQTIQRLLAAQMIEVKELSRNEKRPERTVYQLTSEGLTTLRAWLIEMLSTPAREFPEFPAALAFIVVLKPEEALSHLETRVKTLKAKLAQAQETLKTALKTLPRLFLIEEEYRCAMIQTEINWIESLNQSLRSKELTWDHEWLRSFSKDQLEAMKPPKE